MSERLALTADQVSEALRRWKAGESEVGVCLAIGVTVSTFRRLRRGQLKCLGRRPHSNRDSGRRAADPSPEEILERAAECRKAWGADELVDRGAFFSGTDSRVVRIADLRAALRNG